MFYVLRSLIRLRSYGALDLNGEGKGRALVTVGGEACFIITTFVP